jgi:hypothetical protein
VPQSAKAKSASAAEVRFSGINGYIEQSPDATAERFRTPTVF